MIDSTAGSASAPTELIGPDTVRITFPNDPKWVRTVRLAASGMAATGPFDVETIDDLRIAVDELCSALIEAGTGGDIRLDLTCAQGVFFASGSTMTDELELSSERFALSRQILSVVADEFGLDLDLDEHNVRCWFRRTGDAGGQ